MELLVLLLPPITVRATIIRLHSYSHPKEKMGGKCSISQSDSQIFSPLAPMVCHYHTREAEVIGEQLKILTISPSDVHSVNLMRAYKIKKKEKVPDIFSPDLLIQSVNGS